VNRNGTGGSKSASRRRDIHAFRHHQLSTLTDETGVYALCDLDEKPIYVGQSTDGIRSRVRRHLTSARSDVIANRQIDVWEIGYVWAWRCAVGEINQTEAALFHRFNEQKTLMNGQVPGPPSSSPAIGDPQKVQVLPQDEIAVRRNPTLRLPRQVEHIARLIDHILNVKDDNRLRRSLHAHFERLQSYYNEFLAEGRASESDEGEA
jgi:hypothetical protein